MAHASVSPLFSAQALLPGPSAKRRIRVLDTTLRDGDQSAGFSFTVSGKLEIARALAGAGVDIIEAGFPHSSAADAEACELIASEFVGMANAPLIAVMCRAIPDEIRRSAHILGSNDRGILHLSLPVSDRHIRVKLGIDRAALLSRAVESVRIAGSLIAEIEMGAEDATRTDLAFLAEYCDAVTFAGARSVNIADTVGHALPGEFAGIISYLLGAVPAFRDGSSFISVHCHNDLGLATANTLAAIGAGCGQIEVSVLGLGERTGNVPLEEIAAILDTRSESCAVTSGLILHTLGPLARLVSALSGTAVSPLKPVTGSNIRAHASGIHQQGISRDADTYRSLDLEPFDTAPERIVLSRHSGRSGVESAARRYAGIRISSACAASLLERIKAELSSENPVYGTSEFLCLLQQEKLVDIPLFSCRELHVFSRAGKCELAARILLSGCPSEPGQTNALSRERESNETGLGLTLVDSALDLIRRLCHIDISLRSVSFSGYGSGLNVRNRVYLEVLAPNRDGCVFATERIGLDREWLLVAALLDFVNSFRCVSAFRQPSVDEK